MTTLRIKRLPHAEGLPLPNYAKPGDAGMDLRAAIPESDRPTVLHQDIPMLVPTGFSAAVPEGYVLFVCSRSGLALKGVRVENAPGVVDSGYRGEVGVILINDSPTPFEFKRGDRIAQAVIAPVVRAEIEEADTLDDTIRGEGGFGSTGS